MLIKFAKKIKINIKTLSCTYYLMEMVITMDLASKILLRIKTLWKKRNYSLLLLEIMQIQRFCKKWLTNCQKAEDK